ncbi:hypothetical protein [Echinicola strongylocentroti]|uniref:hypothetical protein n=1 Tax=Echinicola strongylocentroti TaxID=1795355 RepID=UPI0013A6B36C|nr:hypothetical protein [Echinicola strongylocentroti]
MITLYKPSKRKFIPTGYNGDKKALIDIYTIAFNNAEFIKNQILLIKLRFKDPHKHFIIDNSSDVLIREKLIKICKQHQVAYIGLPTINYSPNKSHAMAMHWTFAHLIKKRKPKFFCFLDHDIFPIKDFSFLDKMKNGIYGRIMHLYTQNGYVEQISNSYPYWSIWAGFCFFDYKLFKDIKSYKINFFSKRFEGKGFLDTGGGLWEKIYSKIPYPKKMANFEVLNFREGAKEDLQSSSFELIDGWIHFVSLSNWRPTSNLEEKIEKFNEIIGKLDN